ncbi:MAG: LPXTG cell wall anchor domain-containing protein, partial [Lachnospiraceae bacterium]|nr:LPXTG cell wall anchor domain-containing protein [Lachnospiraceae bacterium]
DEAKNPGRPEDGATDEEENPDQSQNDTTGEAKEPSQTQDDTTDEAKNPGRPEDGATGEEEAPGQTQNDTPNTEADTDKDAEPGEDTEQPPQFDKDEWRLGCSEEHEHTADCYRTLFCGMGEHIHTQECYEEEESLACGMEEHAHTDMCLLSAQDLEKIQAVNELLAALPTPEEIQEIFAEIRDDEEYGERLLALMAQVEEAYDAYMGLTQEQGRHVDPESLDRLRQLEILLEAGTLEEDWGQFKPLGPDEAYVQAISITRILDGVGDFDIPHTHGEGCYDAEESLICTERECTGQEPGNDTDAGNRRIRTFDAIKYGVKVDMVSWDSKSSYNDAYVKMELVLPVSPQEAEFDLTAMTWLDTSEDGMGVRTEERQITYGDGTTKTVTCQVLTGYKHLTPAENNPSVVPGSFEQEVTINVKRMKNGTYIEPMFSAVMKGGNEDGSCQTPGHEGVEEKKTVTAEKVMVTAAPKYNIRIDGAGSYKGTFDFNTGNENAPNKDMGSFIGRLMRMGVTIQLYNDNASKGLKGIELPDPGTDITFDLTLESKYQGHDADEALDVTGEYGPLLWSYTENIWRPEDGVNQKDERFTDDPVWGTPHAPINQGGSDRTACSQGGTWKAIQEGNTIHVTISGWEIDLDHMPTRNGDDADDIYGANVGCFSAGAFFILQPFNQADSENAGPVYDVVEKYGTGHFATNVEVSGLQVTLDGERLEQGRDGFDQMVATDDSLTRTLELILGGTMHNRVRYATADEGRIEWDGVGVEDNRDGRDYAPPEAELHLMGGFSYNPNKEEGNQLYWGTNLSKFYGSAIELTKEWRPALSGGATLDGKDQEEALRDNVIIYYATKQDGTDWVDDDELRSTYEDDLLFYKSLEDIPEGKLCVGILYCFQGPGTVEGPDPYYCCFHHAKVRSDDGLIGNTYMLASTSRVWTKAMYGDREIDEIIFPDWSEKDAEGNSVTKLGDFPEGYLVSANVDGDVLYQKETYREDGSGIVGTHNSDWSHYGDTLLVIGCETNITKNLLQQSAEGTDKKVFDLDRNQRIVDYVLQPGTKYTHREGGGNNGDYYTDIKVVDSLPQHLSYLADSAYYGGEYRQGAADGGVQGTITGGIKIPLNQPVDIGGGSTITMEIQPDVTETEKVNGADVTRKVTRVIWTITHVKVDEKLEPIRFSAVIGTRDNPQTDVPIGEVELLNKSYITSEDDMRAPTVENGKLAKAPITVSRGNATSFGKYALQDVVEEDGEIDYVVYYSNNSDQEVSLSLMDRMPDKENDSDYTGAYELTEWKLRVAGNNGDIAIYYTTDPAYKGKKLTDIGTEVIKASWTRAVIDQNGIIDSQGQTPVAWYMDGRLGSGGNVEVKLKIKLYPDTTQAGEETNHRYLNHLYSGDTTIVTETPTVWRTLEGLTWMDYDRNGKQDEEPEDYMSGVKVSLWKLDAAGEYAPVCYPNTNTPIEIETGYRISLRAESVEEAKVYGPGRYKFTDLPPGTYQVRFNSGTAQGSDLSTLKATIQDCWNNGFDEIDSDAAAVYGESGQLQYTAISGIVMKDAETMFQENLKVQESKFNDSGFYPESELELRKTDGEGNPLSGAAFVVTDADGRVVTFRQEPDGSYRALNKAEEFGADGSAGGARCHIVWGEDESYVLTSTGASRESEITLQKKGESAGQVMEILPQPDGSYVFRIEGTDMCLDLPNVSGWTPVKQWENNGGDNQKWRIRANEDGTCGIQSVLAGSGDEAFMTGVSWRENDKVIGLAKNNGNDQKWRLIPVDNEDGTKTTLTVDAAALKITGLVPGEYTISETLAPAGYMLLSTPVKIRVEKDGSVVLAEESSAADLPEGAIVLTIRNYRLYALPSTGGIGTGVYTVAGILLMTSSAALCLGGRRRARSRESAA